MSIHAHSIYPCIYHGNKILLLYVSAEWRLAPDLLRRHPRIGRLRSFSVPGVRSWVMPDFQNYLIFYLPRRNGIDVIRVLHGARNLDNLIAQTDLLSSS